MITANRAREIAAELGYVETQAAGLFRWFELPSRRKLREDQILAYVSITYYEPRGDMSATVNFLGRVDSTDVFSGYVETEEEFEAVLRDAAEVRRFQAVEELLRQHDPRLDPILTLASKARNAKNDPGPALVIADWLIENGIPF